MSREELIIEMDNFDNIQCENCGTTGKWLVFRIQLDDKDDIISQFKVNLIKQQGQIRINREGGHFSPLDIDFALMKIKDQLLKLRGHSFQSRDNGTAFMMVDFSRTDPKTRVTIVDIDGIALTDVIACVDALRESEGG